MLKGLKRSAQGARVPHEKATAGMATVKMPVPKHVVIPMQMHIGAPAEPVVKKGDPVMVGTLIGKAGGFVSADIHSSVSGTVLDVAPMRMVNGVVCKAVAIQTDGNQTVDPGCVPPPSPTRTACWLPSGPAAWLAWAAPASPLRSSWRPTPSTRWSSTRPSANPI